MCACDWDFRCSACANTWLDDGYPDLPDSSDDREPATPQPREVDR